MATINVISAEKDQKFQSLNVDNIIVDVPTTTPMPGQKGVWVNIKYQYANGKKDKLKIQTPELFSYGISKYEELSPPKMTFAMINRKQRESEEPLTEEEQEDVKVEDATLKIINDITAVLKEKMKRPEMVKALGKQKDKKWTMNVDGMEILRRKETSSGVDNVYLSAKVVLSQNFLKSTFFKITDDDLLEELDRDETVDKLLQKDVNCKAIAMLVIDSIFVGKEPYIQVKLSEVILSEIISYKPDRTIALPTRKRGKTSSMKETVVETDYSDEDSD
jgi:hypothetical protein